MQVKFSESQLTNFIKPNYNTLYTNRSINALEYLNVTYFSKNKNIKKPVSNTKFKTKALINLTQHKVLKTELKNWSKYLTRINDDNKTILVCVVDNYSQNTSTHQCNPNLNLFDINFLRKETIYAKLKYSRSPQYDIVSGGLAAILSGFLGFLICEKFGLELLDSGDFYIAFMYGVFTVFTVRPLLRSTSGFNKDGTYTPNYSILSPQHLLKFYQNLITLLFKLKK